MLELRYKTILAVALPMMISGFIQSLVLITDASFISRYSTEAFDAVGNGGLIYITMYMCLLGMGDGAQIIIARRIGEERPEAIGRIFGSSVLMHCLLAVVLFVILYFLMPGAVLGYSRNQVIAGLQGDYIQIRSFALFFSMITIAIQAFLLAKGKTVVVLIAALITALSNIFLDYALIFGEMGLPEMGLKGAALASTIADGLGMLFLLVYLYFSDEKRKYQLFSFFSYNFQSMKELLKVGSPLMLQGFLALGTWTLFFTWLEQKGQFDLTVSQNIRSIYFLAFVPILGFAGTTKTYISQYLGAKEFDKIPVIQRKIQLLTVGFLILTFHGAILYPETLILMINPEEIYLKTSAEILQLISCSVLLFGIISVYFQTIHGSGNTLHSMLIEFFTVFIYSVFSFLFIKYWNFDVYWIWTIEYIYFGVLGLLSILYLRYYPWKNKIV
jgi:multidrug resistance protein, MATE family